MNKKIVIALIVLGLLLGTVLVATLATPSVSAGIIGGDTQDPRCQGLIAPEGQVGTWICNVRNL